MRKHADWLAWQCSSDGTPRLWARSSHDDRFKVLYLPEHPARVGDVVEKLRGRGCFVTVYPVGPVAGRGRDELGLSGDVELLPGGGAETLPGLLAARRGYYDGVVAGNPEFLPLVKGCAHRPPEAA
jgi:hypothetical protein